MKPRLQQLNLPSTANNSNSNTSDNITSHNDQKMEDPDGCGSTQSLSALKRCLLQRYHYGSWASKQERHDEDELATYRRTLQAIHKTIRNRYLSAQQCMLRLALAQMITYVSLHTVQLTMNFADRSSQSPSHQNTHAVDFFIQWQSQAHYDLHPPLFCPDVGAQALPQCGFADFLTELKVVCDVIRKQDKLADRY
ncbi:hypothetical protein HYFRA_00008546 [Hymenoscyphus fraxineus]|uniref:Uncharacterized protein n=1 Tax=Hymenoscyphus fraxineus TaxID=746836 RepID=A0A9N9PT61_9HELO|nr:hypothetical protein HYFRA_00008546 [Hymenoscyphus fraxineus]